MKKLLLIALIVGCSTEPEEIVIPDADEYEEYKDEFLKWKKGRNN